MTSSKRNLPFQMKFRKAKQQCLATNEMLFHCKTCSFMPFRDKPVVFGCLGRTAAALMEIESLYVNRRWRHACLFIKPPPSRVWTCPLFLKIWMDVACAYANFFRHIRDPQKNWDPKWYLVDPLQKPSRDQMEHAHCLIDVGLCSFVPVTWRNKTDEIKGFWVIWSQKHNTMPRSTCASKCIYPLCKVNSGRAPRELSCSSKATIRKPIYPEDRRSRKTLHKNTSKQIRPFTWNVSNVRYGHQWVILRNAYRIR